MVTSHDTATDAIGRPLAPSLPFRPAADITHIAEGWMIRLAARTTGEDHFRTEVQGRPATDQAVMDCATCGRGVFILSPDLTRPGYQVNVAQLAAAVVSHLHNHHERYLDGHRPRTGAGDPAPVEGASGAVDSRGGNLSAGAADRPADQTGHYQPSPDGAPSAR
jgi:hypothetical protein